MNCFFQLVGRSLPLHALQIRTHDVPELARMIMRNIMGEMRSIPDHHVCAVDRLAIDPAIKTRFVRWTSGNGAIVDLRAMIPENPKVPPSEWGIRHGGCHAVVG